MHTRRQWFSGRGVNENPSEMKSVAVVAPTFNWSRRSSLNVQKILDENAQLMLAIHDYQTKGKLKDCIQFHQIVRRNLAYLVSMVNSNQNQQPPSLNQQPNIQARRMLIQQQIQQQQRQRYQQQLQLQQKAQKQQQQQPSPPVMIVEHYPNSQSLQQPLPEQHGPPQQTTNQVFTPQVEELMQPNGFHLQGSISTMTPSTQQYRPSFPYHRQQTYRNSLSTQNSSAGPSKIGGPGDVYNQPYPGLGYNHQQAEVPSAKSTNPCYDNPLTNQLYQPNDFKLGDSYPQNTYAVDPQNVPPNYPPTSHVQQPINYSSGYRPVTNQPSSGYTGYGNTPINTYASSYTTQSTLPLFTKIYRPSTNQLVPNVAVTVQQTASESQLNYSAPQQPNAQSYKGPNNASNQQPISPQCYPPQQGYQPPPQDYPTPSQPGGYQPYPRRTLTHPPNQTQYPGYPY